jgi:DNA-binding IclR family transcriptional regulator
VVRVLNLLTANPRQRFTLTELARRLDITKATCLGIVGALTEAGYVVRDATSRTYGIGSVLLGTVTKELGGTNPWAQG